MSNPAVSVIGPGKSLTTNLDDVNTGGPDGVVWGVASPQLNTNLVKLAAGATIDAHTNREVDVLVVVRFGTGAVKIDGVDHPITSGSAMLIPVDAERAVQAHTELVYLSIHQRRSGPAIGRRTTSPPTT